MVITTDIVSDKILVLVLSEYINDAASSKFVIHI